jgi:hypothetical protein
MPIDHKKKNRQMSQNLPRFNGTALGVVERLRMARTTACMFVQLSAFSSQLSAPSCMVWRFGISIEHFVMLSLCVLH